MDSSSAGDIALLFESDEASAVLQHTRDTLAQFGVSFVERRVETRTALAELVSSFENARTLLLIVANSSQDPLSDAVAQATNRPVLAVPIEAPGMTPLQALQATARGAAASLAIGKPGAINAALLAIAILANRDPQLRQKLLRFRVEQTERVLADRLD